MSIQPPSSAQKNRKVLGIDVGTSGIRAAIVEYEGQVARLCYSAQITLPLPERGPLRSEQSPTLWLEGLKSLFQQLSHYPEIDTVEQCIVDATSSTVLLCDHEGTPLSPALMYNDQRAQVQAQTIQRIAPPQTGAQGATSTLSKVMWLETELSDAPCPPSKRHICHQIDFINHFLTGKLGVTDENNALKLGYDSVHQSWPKWITNLIETPLPKVVAPGTLIGQIQPGLVKTYGFNPNMTILSGTTDSIAAFLAAGASELGDAVVSLGSTLAIKVIADKPIFAPEYGIYSHKLKSHWLVGGASNTGGAVLLEHFTLPELKALLTQIDVNTPTGLDYYPLINRGERFPIADANLLPKLSPRPKDHAIFCQAILEGLVRIEVLCFERLSQLGVPPIQRILTTGGGVQNSVWMQLRQSHLKAPVTTAKQPDAAFGVTKLTL